MVNTSCRIALAFCFVAGIATTSCGPSVAADRSELPKEVPWLSETVVPPKTIPGTPAEKLSRLLVNANGRQITTLAQWEERRKHLRAAWMKFLGPMPVKREGSKKVRERQTLV